MYISSAELRWAGEEDIVYTYCKRFRRDLYHRIKNHQYGIDNGDSGNGEENKDGTQPGPSSSRSGDGSSSASVRAISSNTEKQTGQELVSVSIE